MSPLGTIKPGDCLVIITYSGKNNPYIKYWIEKALDRKVNIYVISRDQYYQFNTIITYARSRTEHYILSYLILSTLIANSVKLIIEKGLPLDNQILRWYHSIFY